MFEWFKNIFRSRETKNKIGYEKFRKALRIKNKHWELAYGYALRACDKNCYYIYCPLQVAAGFGPEGSYRAAAQKFGLDEIMADKIAFAADMREKDLWKAELINIRRDLLIDCVLQERL
jgi:hypothetical protein